MAFTISTRPDITESLPASLSRAGARAAKESTDKAFQIGINGVGFTLRTNGQHPYMREADQVRKDQFDSSDQAGEQSLGTWWRRSQDDWSLGEGIEWYEPGARDESASRYFEGQGVDPWRQGQMTLLHDVDDSAPVAGTAPVYVSTFRHNDEDGYVVASGDTISYFGASLSGEVRTNHFVLPAFTGRTVDGGTTANMVYTGSDSFGRKIGWTGATGINSFVLSSGDVGTAGLSSRQPVSDLPDVYSVTCDVTSGSANLKAFLKLTIVFYDSTSTSIGSGTEGPEVGLLASGTARLTLQGITIPEGAETYRVKVQVARANGNVFASTENFKIGLALIEEGAILRPPFSGASVDADGVDYAWVGTANASKSTATIAPVGSITLAGSGLTQPVIGGQRIYFGRTDVVGFTTPGGSATTVATCTGQARVWWVKSRLLVAVGQKVYWVNHTVSGQVLETAGILVADGGDGWEWIDIADSPDSILLAGTDGTNSYIYSVTLTADSTAELPVFTGAAEVARLPYGENIRCMGTYLGTYVALGTTLGIRVGLIGEQGRVQYGPILKDLSGVNDVSFYNSFAYFAVTAGHPDGSSGLWRVDLSTGITDTGRNPYAADLFSPGGEAATSVAFLGGSGRPVFAAGRVVYLESASYLPSGWWTNGKVRFRTTAKKDFQHLRVSGILNGGSFDHRALVPDSTDEHRISVQTAQTGLPLANLDIQGGPLFEWLQIKTYITGTVSATPEIESWSLAAIPQPERSRLIRYPLQVWDDETAHLGEHVGYPGFAFDRISAVEQIEDSGIPVLVEDARTGESFIASIETAQFTGVANADRARDNFGGWFDVTVRVRP